MESAKIPFSTSQKDQYYLGPNIHSITALQTESFYVNTQKSWLSSGRNSQNGNPFVIVKLANPQDNKTSLYA